MTVTDYKNRVGRVIVVPQLYNHKKQRCFSAFVVLYYLKARLGDSLFKCRSMDLARLIEVVQQIKSKVITFVQQHILKERR